MPDKCPSCGKFSVELEEHTQRVCSECGIVLEESGFEVDVGSTLRWLADGHQSYALNLPSDYAAKNACIRVQKGKLQGLKVLRGYAELLKCGPALTNQACQMFEHLYELDFVKNALNVTKQIISACCLYIVCRNAAWPVSLKSLCSMFDLETGVFAKWMKNIVKSLDIELKQVDLEDLVATMCIHLPSEAQNLTREVLHICREVILTDGKSPQSVIIAAAFHAWVGLDYNNRQKLKLPRFIKDFQLDKVKGCHLAGIRNRVKEIESLLCKLAAELPWVIEPVKGRSCQEFILDIVKYQKSLTSDALRSLSFQRLSDSDPNNGDKDNIPKPCASTSAHPESNNVLNNHSASSDSTNCVKYEIKVNHAEKVVHPMDLWKQPTAKKSEYFLRREKELHQNVSTLLDVKPEMISNEESDLSKNGYLDREELDSEDDYYESSDELNAYKTPVKRIKTEK